MWHAFLPTQGHAAYLFSTPPMCRKMLRFFPCIAIGCETYVGYPIVWTNQMWPTKTHFLQNAKTVFVVVPFVYRQDQKCTGCKQILTSGTVFLPIVSWSCVTKQNGEDLFNCLNSDATQCSVFAQCELETVLNSRPLFCGNKSVTKKRGTPFSISLQNASDKRICSVFVDYSGQA